MPKVGFGAILLCLIFGLTSACDSGLPIGQPYAFALKVPPVEAPLDTIVPYYWWKELSVFATFNECETVRSNARHGLGSGWISVVCADCSEKERASLEIRLRRVECVPLR